MQSMWDGRGKSLESLIELGYYFKKLFVDNHIHHTYGDRLLLLLFL